MPARRRTALDFRRAQAGDVATGDVAGGDIVHEGVPWQAVLQRLDAEVSFRDALVASYQRERDELRARLDHWERDQELYRDLERNARETRQRILDAELTRLRHLVVGLILGLLLATALLAVLYVDRYLAVALPALLALAALARRH